MTTPAGPIFFSTYGRTTVRGARAAILVHGAGMDQSVWTLQGRHLAFHGWNAMAVDLPGHGRSRGQPALVSVEEAADWILDVAARAVDGPVVLIGHSLGALIALEAAAREPARVGRLCLLGAAAAMPVHKDLLALADVGDAKAADLMLDWGFGRRGRLGGSAMPGGWLLGTARNLLLRGDPAVLASDLHACASYRGGAAAAGRVRCPTLVIVGEEDRMPPARAGRALAATIADARVATIADAGHMMMAEAPDRTLDAQRGFHH
jgi:pimeloyl-ACP methyl ester carboxylesterase